MINTIICPACARENDEATECSRCGCELSILAKISRAAEQELSLGKESLVNSDIPEAMRHAVKSWHLKKTPEAARLAFLTALAAGNPELASWWCVRV